MSPKRAIFHLLGKDPDAVVVSFLSGPPELSHAMLRQVLELVPDRRHYAITTEQPPAIPGVTFLWPFDLPGPLRNKRIGLAPVLLHTSRKFDPLRSLAWKYAPFKLLAFNRQLERHHLKLSTPVASTLFYRGVPLDRIHLRPIWLSPWKRDRSKYADYVDVITGRAGTGNPNVAVVSPYFPYPLSHGGAVRIFNLLSRVAHDFDIHLFTFTEQPPSPEHLDVMRKVCRQMYLVQNTYYREPGWSTLLPPEVHEFRSPALLKALEQARRQHNIRLVQAEYTQMATYQPDILVEHDVTFDLYNQVAERQNTIAARWNRDRWLRFEKRAVREARHVVTMSERDARLLQPSTSRVTVIPNGVDTRFFRPEPERPGANVLFIGSVRHEPNRAAYRFLTEEVWPLILQQCPSASLTGILGPKPELYWPDAPPIAENEFRHAFVSDVRPCYRACHVVVVPTLQSAGTNLKVLEAMAAGRAIVSTRSGFGGIDAKPGEHLLAADDAEAFADAVVQLLSNASLRTKLATSARRFVEQHYDWDGIAMRQVELWRSLL